jgi:WD40 repeat protein/Flp pilus assembly protein TadD/tRNA A-37 threonylcarbamoyl transferase component Bud32
MDPFQADSDAQEQQFNRVVAAYLEAVDAGEMPDRQQWLSRYPEFAVQLADFFAARDRLGRFGKILKEPPSSEIAPGCSRECGDYELLEKLGQGGMGAVYKARHKKLNRLVALKTIRGDLHSFGVDLPRFRNEAEAAALLDHPHIVPIYEVGEHNGQPYFSMKLLEGGSLSDVVAGAQASGVDQGACRRAAQLLVRVARAVHHAHQRGVLHRDLKPSNILLDQDGQPHVTDFGLSRRVAGVAARPGDASLTPSGQIVGTPGYMAPEQASGKKGTVTTAADVYGLGAILYALLSGRPPFRGETLLDTLTQVREREPERPSGTNRTVNRDLETICLKCLDKEPKGRYGSAETLAEDLERWLSGEPIQARPTRRVEWLRRWCKRNRAIAALTGVAALLLIAGVVGLLVSMLLIARQRDEAESQRQLADRASNEAQRQTDEALRAKQDAVQQRDAVSRNLYFADLRLGLEDWNAGNVARLSSKLLSHVPPTGAIDCRGWEWYFLLSLCHQDERTLMHHTREARCVAWSPDGRYLATTGYEGTVQVFDSTAWGPLWTWSGGSVYAACWSPDSQRLAWGTTGPDSGVYVWEVQSGEVKRHQGHTASVWTLAWSPDGKQFASAGMDKTIRVWEPALGTCIRVIDGLRGFCVSLAWHPEGRMLASCGAQGDDVLRIWDMVSGKELWSGPREQLYRGCAAWSPDGKQLALSLGTGECRLYRTADWSLTSRWQGHTNTVNAVAWHPEGSRFASAGADNLIHVWDTASGVRVLTLGGHLDQVLSVAWEPNGRRLASAGMDGLVKVWPVPPAPRARRLSGHSGGVRALAWSDTGETLRSLGTEDGTSALWNVANGQCLARLPVARGMPGLFSSGGRLLALGRTDEKQQEIRILEAGSGKLVQTVRHGTVPPGSNAFSPDDSKLALTDRNAVEIVDLRQNRLLFRWQGVGIYGLSWSPDGRLLAVVGAGEPSDNGDVEWAGWVHVLDIDKRQRFLKLRHDTFRELATAVTWSPDGKRLVSGDVNGLAEVWEAATGDKIASAQLHRAPVVALAWSPDGRRVASGSKDGTVRLWEPSHGEELLQLEVAKGEVTHLAWSPNGRCLAAATADGALHLWDASAGYDYVHSETYYFEQVHGYLKQATQRWEAGRKEEARALYKQTLETDRAKLTTFPPWVGKSIRDCARTARYAGQAQEAIALSQVLVLLHKDDALVCGNLSRGLVTLSFQLERRGQWEEAIASCREAIRLNKDDAGAALNLAWLLAACPDPKFRDVAQAIVLAKSAVELKPSAPRSWTILGVALYRAGNWQGAATALEQSLQLQPAGPNPLNWLFLAMAHEQMGDKIKARKWYDQAVEWMDKNPRPHGNDLLRPFREEATELLNEKAGTAERK